VTYIPAHLVAPLPTHPDFQHDPHLPEALGRPDPAARLRRTLAPILDPLAPSALPPAPAPPSKDVEAPPPVRVPRHAERVLDPVAFRRLKLIGKSRLSHNTAR
jgi:hypothetical protein